MTECPCGSQADYLACCGLYIENQQEAKTPEALMRSRYTAYTQAKMDYIKRTMLGKPLEGFDEIRTAHWARQVNWTGLEVIKSYLDKANDKIGYVEFIANYLEEGQAESIHELSTFKYHQGRWFYTEGLHQNTNPPARKQKISRNAPCPCGSQRKFKNCHGAVE